jgi:aspartate racemase
MNLDDNIADELTSEDIRALLTEQLSEGDGGSPAPPLSPAQQRLWFLDQLEPNSPRYNIPSIAWLVGKLDVPALQRTLSGIVNRHESLRARFINEDGEPAQVIGPEDEFQLRQEDLTHVPLPQRDAVARQLVRDEVKRPFDLREGRPLRASLLRLGPEEHLLVINMHHIVSDEWSYKIFYRELEAFYTSFSTGVPATLPELPIQYSDYAAWQREWLESEDFQAKLQFWKNQLAGHPVPVNLPTDRPRHQAADPNGAVDFAVLPPELATALKDLASRETSTLYMVLLTAFKVLLYHSTGQTDIIVGSPMAGRNHIELEEVIGFFANTLPLRTHVSAEMTFRQFLAQVREVALAGYSHQDVPFEKLVEVMQPERSPGQTPFINVLFLFQSLSEMPRLPGVKMMFLDAATDTAKFDVTLFTAEVEEGLVIAAEYKTSLFNPETIAKLMHRYEQLLRDIVRDPGQRVFELTLRTDEELKALPPLSRLPQDAQQWQDLDYWFDGRAKQAASNASS